MPLVEPYIAELRSMQACQTRMQTRLRAVTRCAVQNFWNKEKRLVVTLAAVSSIAVSLLLPLAVPAQAGVNLNNGERGAVSLGSTLEGIGTTGRVLTIAAHPDDEDTQLIAWLARGRHVETGYLSLTRGDGGQNLIGNELGEGLGAIRTQELLSARRIDQGRQFFTRAYDFGFSKNAEETFEHWPRDTILGDVVRVVRAFRPQVIVAFFSGTPRDGHGHHQVSGILAREAYDLAADTVRFPVREYGLPWTVLKFYRSSRQAPDSATLRINTGEYDPLSGRSYYEISAESRSQHKSQGFGMLQRKGVMWAYLSREASRVGPASARSERSIFDGVDTSWAAMKPGIPAAVVPSLDSALSTVEQLRAAYRANEPERLVSPLAQVLKQLRTVINAIGSGPAVLITDGNGGVAEVRARPTSQADPALWDAISLTVQRTELALVQAAGVAVEATVPRSTFPVRESAKIDVNDSLPVSVTVFNRGKYEVDVNGAGVAGIGLRSNERDSVRLMSDSAATLTRYAVAFTPNTPWWRQQGRQGHDWFIASIDSRDEVQRESELATFVNVWLGIAGERVNLSVPVVYRFADPVKGDVQVPVLAVPGITVNLAGGVEYIRAGVPVERIVQVRVESAYPHSATVRVRLEVPEGLVADSIQRIRTLPAQGSAIVSFKLRGTLKEGPHRLVAAAFHEDIPSTLGVYPISYDHITPMRLYGTSSMVFSSVTVKTPVGARVGYIAGSADGGMEALRQLDIPVEFIELTSLATVDLSRFTSIVVGPRAYETHPELVQQNQRLLNYVNRGGNLVVQYGAQDMSRFSVTPYPLQWARPAARVTMEDAPVTVLQPANPILTTPNRITERDWSGWVQERATYMPSTIDPRYTALLAMNDPGEAPNKGALLVANVGKGRYVYVTLALFRQLPAGVPGAARLWANLVTNP